MVVNANLLEPFLPLIASNYTYYVYYGGRGGGKSEGIAEALILLSTMEQHRILCIREVQNTISESVKTTLENWITKLELNDFFKITKDEIIGANGSKFIFKGMQTYNAVNIKSIANITITWIEEGEAFSKRSWELLVPSVLRTENPKIVCSFNPTRREDILYQTFILNTPPPKSFIKKINYNDNPYLPKFLNDKREHDFKTLPEGDYKHIWEGELISFTEGALWNELSFRNLISNEAFDISQYTKIVIGTDPATTNKDYSNEYGIIVAGITLQGNIHIIEDKSGHYSPVEFCNVISILYQRYKANEVVVETNNGGDFIKSTLLTNDKTLNIKEVRATKDKINRALPVANLAYLNKIKHINGGHPLLERQMKLTTSQGFKGAIGESADRLDAMVWACYDLLNINDLNSFNNVFSNECFKEAKEYDNKTFLKTQNIIFLNCNTSGSLFFYCFDIYELDNDIALNFKEVNYFKKYSEDIANRLKYYYSKNNNYLEIYARDNFLNTNLINQIKSESLNISLKLYTDEYFKDKLNVRVLKVKDIMQIKKITYDKNLNEFAYNNEYGNILKMQLNKYHTEANEDNYDVLNYFLDIIQIEYDITDL